MTKNGKDSGGLPVASFRLPIGGEGDCQLPFADCGLGEGEIAKFLGGIESAKCAKLAGFLGEIAKLRADLSVRRRDEEGGRTVHRFRGWTQIWLEGRWIDRRA